MIQGLSGFVALRDMVRHTQSQFHLRQFDWVLMLWCLCHVLTHQDISFTSHRTDSETDSKNDMSLFVWYVVHGIFPPQSWSLKRKTFEHIYFCILFTLYSMGLYCCFCPVAINKVYLTRSLCVIYHRLCVYILWESKHNGLSSVNSVFPISTDHYHKAKIIFIALYQFHQNLKGTYNWTSNKDSHLTVTRGFHVIIHTFELCH